MIENDLAQELNVSRVPVREALRLLESQGIVINAYREMRMFKIDHSTLSQILTVRLLLEKHATERAMENIGKRPELLEPFEDALNLMSESLRKKHYYGAALADMAFHGSIYAAVGNPALDDIWRMLSRKMLIIIGLSLYKLDNPELYISHLKLFDLIRGGDVVAALAEVEVHIMDILDTWQYPENVLERV